ALGRDAPAHRDALRSLRAARARRPLPRALLRREVRRGRDALRRQPGARRGRPPVGDHARNRGRAAGDRLLRAVLRAGGRVDPPRRAPRTGRSDGRERLPASVDEAGGPVPRAAAEGGVPVVSVLDGHSHALAFIGAALGVPQLALGVDDFGQSGTRADLYRHYGIDAAAIARAAVVLLGG